MRVYGSGEQTDFSEVREFAFIERFSAAYTVQHVGVGSAHRGSEDALISEQKCFGGEWIAIGPVSFGVELEGVAKAVFGYVPALGDARLDGKGLGCTVVSPSKSESRM